MIDGMLAKYFKIFETIKNYQLHTCINTVNLLPNQPSYNR